MMMDGIRNEDPWELNPPVWVFPMVVAALAVTACAALYIYLGWLLMAQVALSGAIAMAAWLRTTYRHPRMRRILPLYVLAIVALLAQGMEQWAFHYATALTALLPGIFAAPVVFDEATHMTVYVTMSTTLLLLGGLGIALHHPLGNFMAWFAAIYALVSSLALFTLPFFAEQGFVYVPGTVLAVPVFILGILMVNKLARAGKSGDVK